MVREMIFVFKLKYEYFKIIENNKELVKLDFVNDNKFF